jgi:hypothetical protein
LYLPTCSIARWLCSASSRVGARISAGQPAPLFDDAVDQRQPEGQGLAGAGARLDDQVVPAAAGSKAARCTAVGG